jgi:glycosyltransferase involved in cell wall biosynthesis
MRVLFDARSLVEPNGGGVSRVGRELLSAFVATTSDEIILATTGSQKPDLSAFIRNEHVRHIHLSLPNKFWSLLVLLGLTALDREIEKRVGKIDVVFLPNVGFIGKLRRTYVLLVHDLSFLLEPRWFSFKTRWWHHAVRATRLIKDATRLLAVSETTKIDTVKLLSVPAERIDVIPLGISFEKKDNNDSRMASEKKYALALGANDPRKNAATATEAVRLLKTIPRFKDVELKLLGNGSRPSDEELTELYLNASAFLYPSWYEGFGLPLHEAATFGVPCIASFAGALPETAPKGTVFVDPTKPHHWAKALQDVLENSQPTSTNLSPKTWEEAAKRLNHALDAVTR